MVMRVIRVVRVRNIRNFRGIKVIRVIFIVFSCTWIVFLGFRIVNRIIVAAITVV